MTYEDVHVFSQSWGMVYLMALFFGVCLYALWPGNRDKFDEAARRPLDEED